MKRSPHPWTQLPWPLGTVLTMRVEVARGDFAKRSASGRIEFVSPFRCPFNYGSVVADEGPDPCSADGEGYDAVWLGRRVRRGERRTGRLVAVALFIDGGLEDHKFVLSDGARLSHSGRLAVERFCSRYARIKRWAGRDSRFEGWW
ncbi:MAG: hypothetical protein AAF411_19065 [Myxococcota bacterium]